MNVTTDTIGAFGGTPSYGGPYTYPHAINDKGTVVGWASTAQVLDGDGGAPPINAAHAFAFDGQLHDLGTLGGPESQAFDINENGQIVGWAQRGLYDGAAFLYEDDQLYDLNTLTSAPNGWQLQQAIAINDAGFILATSWDDQANVSRYFLLAPITVPEPTTLYLLAPLLLAMRKAARTAHNPLPAIK